MKKFVAILLALTLALSLVACGGAASSAPASEAGSNSEPAAETGLTTVNPGKLTMSTNAAFPPYEMTTDSGDFEGIDIEVAAAIAEKLGLELQIDDMDFDAALLAAQQGKSDMVMAGVTVTEDRLKIMDFSDSYATGIQSIIVPEGSEIASVDDLAGHLIGTQRGTTGYIYCSDEFGEDSVIAYDNGLTEYAVEDYASGMAKGNTALVEAVNAALAELIADGTVQSIVDKYISAN